MINKFLIAFLIIDLLLFNSCVQKQKQPVFNVPPLPVIDSDLANSATCIEQKNKFISIEQLLLKKKFKPALEIAAEIASTPCSFEIQLRVLELIGDIFNEMGEDTNAFYFYNEALSHKPEEPKTKVLIEKIAVLASGMESKEIIPLLSQIKNKDVRDQILLQSEFKQTKEFKKNIIGVLLPLSGYYEMGGQKALYAVQMAVDKFNYSQDNIKFHLLIEDTASDPVTAVTAVKKLNHQKAACIIGPMVSARSAAIEAENLGIPMIAMSQKSEVTADSHFVLRNYMTPSMQIRTGISYYIEEYGFTSFAILYPDEKYGNIFKDTFVDVISGYDAELTEMISYEPSQTDFSDQINQLITGYQRLDKSGEYVDMEENEKIERNRIYRAKTDFDVLFIPDAVDTINMIAPQLKYHYIETELMGTNLWNSPKLLKAKDYVQAAVFPDGFHPDAQSAEVLDFTSSCLETTGILPGYNEAIAYDTAMIVMETLASPSVNSKEDVVDFLHSSIFNKTVTCPTSFDLQGEPVKSLKLFQVAGSEIKLIRSCDN
ncbi:MAG: penicillin-binding protein activator [Thermodesulfobacteriota bacterium]